MAARLTTCFILVIMCYTDCDAMSFNLPNLKTGTIGLPTNLNTNLAPMAPAAIPAPIVAPSSVPGPSEPIPGPSPAIPGPSAAVPGLTAASPAPSGPGGQSSLGTFNPLSASKKQLNIFKDVDLAISPSAFGLDFNILKSKTETGLTQSNCGKKCTETDDCVMVLHCLMETSAPVTTDAPCVFEIGKPPCKFTPGGGKSSGRADEYCHIFKQTPTQEAFGNADWGSNCTYAVYHPDCRDPEGIPESWKPAKRPPVFGEGSSVVIQYECKEGYTADAFGALIATCLMDGTVELREDYKCSRSESGSQTPALSSSQALLPLLPSGPQIILTNPALNLGDFNQRPQATAAPAITPAPTTTTPAPTTTTPAPTTTTPAPTTTTPAPTTTTPAPTTTTLAPTTTTPTPTTTTPAPTTTTPAPTTTTPAPTTTTPAPTTTTPAPTTTTPAPTTTTPAPTTTTPAPTTTTPAPTTTTPAPTTTTPAPTTTTPAPTTTTPAPTTTTPAPTTTTPAPTTTTPAPTTTTPAPTTTTPTPTTTTTTTTTPAPTTTTTTTTTPAPTTTTTTSTTPAPTTTTTTTSTTPAPTTTTTTTTTSTAASKIDSSEVRPLDCMAGFIYKSEASLCFKVFTGTALNFNYAEYMCNYYTGGAGGLASLSTTKKFHTVQKYLQDERRDGTYFWVGSEQWQDTDYYYYYTYYYTFYYYYFYYYFYFYDYNYWADDHKVDYHLWAPGEPNGDYEKCNAIARNKDLQLMDSSCSNKFDFICDIPVLEPDRPLICDSDYIYHRDSNICFKLVHVETEPERAEDKCKNDGYGTGRLAVLNTMDKFNDVTNHLKDIGEWYPYIVGASQISMWYENNRWNDGTPIDAAVWAPDEPNSIYEDCADLRRNFGYKLNDISCNDDAHYYICDIPI